MSSFPKEETLDQVAALPLDLAGCVDMFAEDTLAVFKTPEKEYLWEAYSLNSLRPAGRLLRKGHGHDEFEFLPSDDALMRTDSALLCDFWINYEKRWCRLNLTSSLREGRPVYVQTQRFDIYNGLSNVAAVGDSAFLFVTNKDYTGLSRSLWRNGKVSEVAHLGNLNDVAVENELNTLSFVYCVNPQRKMVAEAMLNLNQINLYSVDAGRSLTLCVGTELSDVSAVDNLSKRECHYYYGSIRAYGNYFVALYQNVPVKDYWEGKGTCELQFFSWDGRPLLRLSLPVLATSFHISQNRYIYVFSSLGEEEALYKYDCGNLLQSIL